MSRKKKIGFLFILLGLALIIAGAIIWLDSPELTSILLISGGVFSTIGGVIMARDKNPR